MHFYSVQNAPQMYLRLAYFCLFLAVTDSWVWKCLPELHSCQRTLPSSSSIDSSDIYPTVGICRLVCDGKGNIWPQPLDYITKSSQLISVNAINATFSQTSPNEETAQFLQETASYFKNVLNSSSKKQRCSEGSFGLTVHMVAAQPSLKLNWETNEEYVLTMDVNSLNNTVVVSIEGETVFGVRHGVETLLQLIEQDPQQSCFVTLASVKITDRPAYKHRGLLLDSARNFLSIDAIKINIKAMAISKMNVLHWHLSDSQSFPFVSSHLPNMSIYGAYSESQTYTPSQIRDLIKFATLHGVRIIPEIDGPAHTGNGWQWGPSAGLGNLVVCYNQQPYRSYCIQPPCGQMNPANPRLYEILQTLYGDIIDLWAELDAFHMGGDEVYLPCWNSSEEIIEYIKNDRTEDAFLKLWAEYQEKALKAFDVAASDTTTASVILWTSTLTDPAHVQSYLPKDRYIIQTWVPKSNTLPKQLLELGYKLIISTKDSWYLDHGFWGTTTYYKWTDVYDNTILNEPGVLGGEVCMWGELVDDNNVEPRAWPRAAAAAERLWSNPSTTTSKNATSRFFSHNDRLADRGVKTSAVTPSFCSVNAKDCDTYLNN